MIVLATILVATIHYAISMIIGPFFFGGADVIIGILELALPNQITQYYQGRSPIESGDVLMGYMLIAGV